MTPRALLRVSGGVGSEVSRADAAAGVAGELRRKTDGGGEHAPTNEAASEPAAGPDSMFLKGKRRRRAWCRLARARKEVRTRWSWCSG